MLHKIEKIPPVSQGMTIMYNNHYLVLEITVVFDYTVNRRTYCYLDAYWPTEGSVLVKPQSLIKSFSG